ncbi:MAG: nucleotidyltransferase domain-containing protein, partial [bacterium]
SRVAGGGNERSDIDIGIEGKEEIPHQKMFHIKEEIENLPILYKIEVVDFKKVSPDFRDVACKDVESIL